MDSGITKTIVCLLFIGIGFLLKQKVDKKEQLVGVKVIILSIALPATIFIALLKIDIKPGLIALPFMALAINLLLFLSTFVFLRLYGIKKNSPTGRTILLLLASMAPGLSCFPFVMEYLGDQHLAFAAFADVGNKFYGLILLYLIAMHWYYKLLVKNDSTTSQDNNRVKELLLALVKEPINIVLVVALAMLIFGQNLQSLPAFMQVTFQRLSQIMTPLVLIYIGLAVSVSKNDIAKIFNTLTWKSGMAFLLSGILIAIMGGGLSPSSLLLIVIFPQSSCSFWPFAHMTAVSQLEKKSKSIKTFDTKFALNLLAFSLPYSTIMILSICSIGPAFAHSGTLIGLGIILISAPLVVRGIKKKSQSIGGRERTQLSSITDK